MAQLWCALGLPQAFQSGARLLPRRCSALRPVDGTPNSATWSGQGQDQEHQRLTHGVEIYCQL
jgi:hypothetical protein